MIFGKLAHRFRFFNFPTFINLGSRKSWGSQKRSLEFFQALACIDVPDDKGAVFTAEAQKQLAETERQRAEEQTRAAQRNRTLLRRAAVLAVIALILAIAASISYTQADKARQRAVDSDSLARIAAREAELARDITAQALIVAKHARDTTAQALKAVERARDSTALALEDVERARDSTQTALDEVDSRRFATQAAEYLDDQLDLALLLSAEATERVPTLSAQKTLIEALQHNPS